VLRKGHETKPNKDREVIQKRWREYCTTITMSHDKLTGGYGPTSHVVLKYLEKRVLREILFKHRVSDTHPEFE